MPINYRSAFRAVVWTLGGLVLCFMLAGGAFAHGRHHRVHYLAQGALRHAQAQAQPWAWSKPKSPVVNALGHGLAHMIGAEHLSAACQTARALGGPCGCFASEFFFGHSVRDLWRHEAWLRFPRAEPAAGTAAIWMGRKGHHVAPVVAVNGNGTITIHDNMGVRTVNSSGLIFVRPQ